LINLISVIEKEPIMVVMTIPYTFYLEYTCSRVM